MGGMGGMGGGGGAGGGVTQTTQGSVTVSAESTVPVAKTFFGQNYWSWVDAWGDPVDAVQTQAAELELGLLRAGGANNDKQDPEPFSHAKIDAFVAYARAIGAEPLLQVPVIKNDAGEPATAADAAAMVAYVNETQGYGVRYFSIGNEPDLYVDQSLREASFDATAACVTFSEFARAMKNVDPTIQIVGPDLSWKYQSGANDWLTPFLTSCGDDIDVVAVHRYPFAPTACNEAAAYSDNTAFRATLTHLRSIMQATGQADKPLAITEANITYDGTPEKSTLPASPGTLPAALWLADNVGVALEEGLLSVNYWSLSEGWTLGFIDGATPRPAYYALQLFATGFGTAVLHVSGAPSGVSVYAGRDDALGKTSVFVVNKTAANLELSTTLVGVPRSDAPTLKAPPHSLLRAVLPDSGEAPELTLFSSGMSVPGPVSD
jgi:hypothetical protein